MKYDIFISYRRDGGFETAKHLNDLLVHDGYTVSFDIDTLREGDFDETLLRRIGQCVDFILVVDKHTFDRTLDPEFDPKKDWLRTELAYALKLRKNIIPVLLSGANFPNDLPNEVKEIQLYNGLFHNSEYFDAFYMRMKGFLHSQPRNIIKDKYDIFISYRRVDGRDYARTLQKALQLRGYKVFLDYEELTDGTYGERIRDAIKNASVFMMVLSPQYLDRCKYEDDLVRQEIMIAIQQKKYIIPINPNKSFDGFPNSIPDEIKRTVGSYQFAEVDFGEYFEDSIDKIVNTRILDKTQKKVSKSHDIFLAYPRKDFKAGEKLSKIIQSNGFSVWRDVTGIMAGEQFVDCIINAINNSKAFIALYSSWALESVWFKKELEYAQKKNIPVIKVLTDTPEGLYGVRRMTFGTILEMGCTRFDEKLLSTILNNGCKPDTTEMYAYGKELFDNAKKAKNKQDESMAFLTLMRAAELGSREALSYIETRPWDIDLKQAVSRYRPINSYFIEDMRADLYNQGEILAEDETLTDNSQRGRGMEKSAFRLMKRAIDLGYDGSSPIDYYWCYLSEQDYEECLDMLGASSRIYERDNVEDQKPMSTEQQTQKNHAIQSSVEKMVEKKENHRVFISYKRVDKEKVFEIKNKIDSTIGEECWIDFDGIESDSQFAKVIIGAINRSTVFLFMYSAAHAAIEDYENDWTVRELLFAQKTK